MRMMYVKEEYLERAGEFLELDYVPRWVAVEDFRDDLEAGKVIETLRIEWTDGNQVFSSEMNDDFAEAIWDWEYEDEE